MPEKVNSKRPPVPLVPQVQPTSNRHHVTNAPFSARAPALPMKRHGPCCSFRLGLIKCIVRPTYLHGCEGLCISKRANLGHASPRRVVNEAAIRAPVLKPCSAMPTSLQPQGNPRWSEWGMDQHANLPLACILSYTIPMKNSLQQILTQPGCWHQRRRGACQGGLHRPVLFHSCQFRLPGRSLVIS